MTQRPDYLNQNSEVKAATVEEVQEYTQPEQHRGSISTEAEKVLKNTYFMLALQLGTGAIAAYASMAMGLPHPGVLMTLVGYFALMFAISKTQDSGLGIAFGIALAGFMGYTLGPILSAYASIPGGSEIIMLALASTGGIFVAMSAWILVTGKDLGGMGKTLMIGLLVAFVMGIANIWLQVPAMSLAVSAMFTVLSSLLIAYQTSAIVNGGERNYISAATTIWVSLFNIFISLLNLFGVLGSDD